MKKAASTLLALAALVIPALAHAQVNVNANNTVAVNARVLGSFRWSAGQSLEFGDITSQGDGSTASVAVAPSQSSLDGNNRRAGYVELFFNSATDIIVTDVPESLTGSGANTLPVSSFSCGIAAASVDPAVSGFAEQFATCADGQAFTQLGVTTAARRVRFWFGGTLAGADLDSAVADTYTGTITLTAAQP